MDTLALGLYLVDREAALETVLTLHHSGPRTVDELREDLAEEKIDNLPTLLTELEEMGLLEINKKYVSLGEKGKKIAEELLGVRS